MNRTQAVDNTPTLPAYTDGPNAAGYFKDGTPGVDEGTILDPDSMNMPMQELANLVELFGVTLDPLDDGQVGDVLESVKGIEADATDTGTTSTQQTRALLASQDSRAQGVASAVAGSQLCGAQGDASFVGGSGLSGANGDDSAVVGSVSTTADGDRSAAAGCHTCDVDADESFVGGSKDSSTHADAQQAGVVASDDTHAEGDQSFGAGSLSTTLTGARTGALGTNGCEVSGDEAAAVAADSCKAEAANALAAASARAYARAAQSTVLSCQGSGTGAQGAAASGENSVLCASRDAELITAYNIGGGDEGGGAITPDGLSNKGLTWRINSATGDMFSDGTLGAGGADVAELWPNEVPGVIEVGRLVTQVGDAVRLAGPGDDLLGVVSVAPALLMNAAPTGWAGRNEVDRWGRPVRQTVPYVSWPERCRKRTRTVLREAYNGPVADAPIPVPDDATTYTRLERVKVLEEREEYRRSRRGKVKVGRKTRKTVEVPYVRWPRLVEVDRTPKVTRPGYSGPLAEAPTPIPEDARRFDREVVTRVENFDGAQAYVPRVERPEEWTAVGYLGRLLVEVDDTVRPGDVVLAGDDGIGTRAAKGKVSRFSAAVRCLSVRPTDGETAVALCYVRP